MTGTSPMSLKKMARGALPHAITKLNKYSMNHLKNVAKESSLFSTAKVRRKLETTSQGARHGVLNPLCT